MKLSHHALSFLLAQYRAIFKRAYLKGLAPAVLLTAALAAGATQAASGDSTLDAADFASGGTIPAAQTITQDSTLNLKDIKDEQHQNGWTYMSNQTIKGAAVTIKGAEERFIGVSGDSNITIQDGGSLSFLNDRNCNSMLYGGDSNGNAGTLTVTGAGSSLTAQSTMIEFNEVKINSGAAVTIGGMFDADSEALKADAITEQVGQWVHYANVYANKGDSGGEATLYNATLNLEHESIFGADTSVTIKDESVVNFNGEWRALTDTTGYATAFLRANSGSDAIVTISGTVTEGNGGEVVSAKIPELHVANGKHGAIFAPKISLTNAQVNIGSGSTLTFDGDWSGSSSADKKKATNEGNHSSTTLSLKDVVFNNQGTAIIGNASSGGTATFEGDVKLQGNVNNFAQVTISGSKGNDAHLIVSEEQILKPSGKGEGWFAGKDGSILISGSSFDNAVLELVGTDSDGLDLNKDIPLTSGDSVKLGQIGVSGSGTLAGEHFVLSQALSLGEDNKLALDADVLELKSTSSSTDTLSGFGVEQLTAHDNLVLEASGASFAIDKAVLLSRDFFIKDALGNNTTTANAVATITGDDLTINNSGSLHISGGAYENEGQDLTIVSGSLTVSSLKGIMREEAGTDGIDDDPWTYFENGNPSSLTWTGKFVLSGSDATKAQVNISGDLGAGATLDLTHADITWGSGTITVAGGAYDYEEDHISATDYFARSGFGTLHLTSSQFADYLDLYDSNKSATQLVISSGGVLLVDGGISTPLNFDKFTSGGEAVAAGKVNFSGESIMLALGDLSLETGTTTNGHKSAAQTLTLGGGFIGATGISINNHAAQHDSSANDYVAVSGGALAVTTRFDSDNHEVRFTGTRLDLDSFGLLDKYGVTYSGAGVVNVDKLSFSGKGSGIQAWSGEWKIGRGETLGDIDLTNGADIEVGYYLHEYNRKPIHGTLQADNVGISGSGSIAVNDAGIVTFNTLQAGKDATIKVTGGSLTVTGQVNDIDLKSAPTTLAAIGSLDQVKAQAGIALSGANITLDHSKFIFGDSAARALLTFDTTAQAGQQAVVNKGLSGANFTLTGTSELRFDFAEANLARVNGGKALTAQQAQELKNALFKGDRLEANSYINIGALALDFKYDSENMTAQWSDIEDFSQIGGTAVTNNVTKQLLIQNVDQGKNKLSGQFGAVEASSSTPTQVAGALGLHKAYGEGSEKFFASTVQNGERVAAGLKLAADASVALYGAGTIGTLTGDASSTLIFNAGEDDIGVPGTTIIKPTSSGKAIAGIGSMVVNNNVVVEGSAEVGAVTVNHSLSAENLTVGTKDGATSTILGNLEVAETLTVKDSTLQLANGTVNTSSLVLNGATLMVGWDAQATDKPNSAIDESASYTGALYAGTVDLSNGGIVVDPDLKHSTAIVGLKQFKDGDRAQSFNLGETGGNLFVGQNSAIGAGFDSMEDLAEFIAPQQVNGALSGKYKAILAVDGLMTVSDGTGLTMTAKSSQGFADYIKSGSSLQLSEHGTIANAVYFGAESALKLRAEAVAATATGSAPAARAAQPAVIKLDTKDGKLIADGGEVLISGDLRANQNTSYQLFTDADGKVDVVNLDGTEVEEGKGIKVATENGLLFGQIDNTNGGIVNLQVDEANAGHILSAASAPVVETLLTYIRGYHVSEDEDGNEVHDPLYNGYEEGASGEPVKNLEYSNYFLADSIDSNGAAAEAAARLSVYGGAPQAALSAGKSSTDAIAQRFGIGAQSNLTLSGNSQGATLWLAPVYKSIDSDGFEAQGVDYGVDVDLYGVALGADYTLSNGVTFGAMFNVGAGDIDGEGAAAQVSNDFDYYGFGLYAGYSVGQLSVIGDVSYTVADNEIEANTEIDKIGAKMDSSNLSLGVTGKYELNFNGVAITPHAGLRFSSIDLDDYTIDGEDNVASVDSDRLNLFAIPVGLTVAKEFKAENWTVAPSFDLTLTGQFGDDELDGDVAWAGVSNLSTHTTTEVIDNFTYGATLGVEAQSTSGIALGLSVGYTGSSNTDEFGVNANARFSF